MISTAAKDRFSDWVNPMVIKELRQGLAARTFHVAFLLIHVVMAIFLWFGLINPETLGALIGVIGFFLVLVQPVGAINAVASERRAGSMDLVGLTNLSAWQIVWGKFCARSAITLLFFVSVLPYVVLRYFAGGLDIVSDAVALSYIVFASLVLSAVMTGFSAFESKFLRGVIIGGIVLLLLSGGNLFFMMRSFGGSFSSPATVGPSPAMDLLYFACNLVAPVLFAAVMLLVGAVQLSPPSGRLESVSRRLIWTMGLLGFLQMASHGFSPDSPPFALFWAFAANFIVTFQGFQRGLSPAAIRLSPIAGKPFPFHLIGRLLHPGWPFALLQLIAVSLFLAGLALRSGHDSASLSALLWFALAPILILVPPLALTTVFTRLPFLLAVIIWFVLGLVLWGTAGMLDSTRAAGGLDEVVAAFSWCGLPVVRDSAEGAFWIVQGVLNLVCVMVILRSLVKEGFTGALRHYEGLARERLRRSGSDS